MHLYVPVFESGFTYLYAQSPPPPTAIANRLSSVSSIQDAGSDRAIAYAVIERGKYEELALWGTIIDPHAQVRQ